jgi:hypothetical protein
LLEAVSEPSSNVFELRTIEPVSIAGRALGF